MTTHLRLVSKKSDHHGPNIGYVARAHLNEVAKLARKAEWWGAPPQGERLMGFAYHLDQGTMLEAAAIRDEIRADLRTARINVLEDILDTVPEMISNAFSALGNALLMVLMCIPAVAIIGGFIWLLFLR